MGFDQSYQHTGEKKELVKGNEQNVPKPIYFLPFDIQLLNTFCIEIMARRFPIDIETMPHIQVGLEEAQVDIPTLRAQITLSVQTVSDNNPTPFDISFKLVGLFTYTKNYQEEEIRSFLEQGSLSILLPFARELLFSICARLQIPPMMLTMVQLVPHPSIHKSFLGKDFNNETKLEQ